MIFSSAVQIINQQTSVEDINRCLELIRLPHTSGKFLVNVIVGHQLMKDPSRDKYLREALLYQLKKPSTPEVKPPRYWGIPGIYYITKDHSMYQYVTKAGNNECVNMMNLPEWVDQYSFVASNRERVVIVGGYNGNAGDKHALLLDMADNTKVTQLPDLPEPRYSTSLVLSDNDVYVVGGFNGSSLSSVYYLSLGSEAWQAKKAIPHKIYSPLVVQHQQCLYVLGGYANNGPQSSLLQQYNIEDDTWKQRSDMPVACSSYEAGVVVHEDRIKVITVDKCLMYANDTDTWTVKQYNKLGKAVKPFVRGGQIYAVVQNGGTYSMMRYDDVDNVWKTEHEKIDNAWSMWLFC